MSGPPLAPFGTAAIVVAAGKGLRAGQPVPKQFAIWHGKPVVRHSAERFAALGIAPIVIAIPEGAEQAAGAALQGIAGVRLVTGGDTRQQSVRFALEALSEEQPRHVLIHDAARPIVPAAVVERLLAALVIHPGAIPVLPLADSLAHEDIGMMGPPADRAALRRVQTPQAFDYAAILAAHRAWDGAPNAGDDAQIGQAAGLDIALVEGDEALRKLTFAADFAAPAAAIRVGTGFDVHRLVDGEALWLGGVRIPHDRGLAGHSDADVAMHALVDAILGAIAADDIGAHFPPSDPQWRGAASDRFLAHAVSLAADAGYIVGNADLTIVCEAPRIGPHRQAMRERLAAIIGVSPSQISVKATTTEGLGFTGRGEGIAAQAVVILQSIGSTE